MLHLFFKKLHWLPIKQRIYFKIATLVYRHFNNTLPSYLSARLTAYTASRSLRSCSAQLLSPPRVNLKTAGERSFRFQAPRIGILCLLKFASHFLYHQSRITSKLIYSYKHLQTESSGPSCPAFPGLLVCVCVEVGEEGGIYCEHV